MKNGGRDPSSAQQPEGDVEVRDVGDRQHEGGPAVLEGPGRQRGQEFVGLQEMLQDVEEHDASDVVHTIEGGAHGVEVRQVALGRRNATLVHEADRHRVDLQAVVANTDILKGVAHNARAGAEVDHGARSV